MINRMEAECLHRSSVTTALSQYTIDSIGRIHGIELARAMRLIPGWVDTSRFVPLEDRQLAKTRIGWPTDRPILFTLRRLVSRMGLDRLLNASHRLLEEGLKFHLVIAGSGPLRGRLEEQARALGSVHVTFLGRLEDRELPLAYGACDAFVLPTAELECFGLIAWRRCRLGGLYWRHLSGRFRRLFVSSTRPGWHDRRRQRISPTCFANTLQGNWQIILHGSCTIRSAALTAASGY